MHHSRDFFRIEERCFILTSRVTGYHGNLNAHDRCLTYMQSSRIYARKIAAFYKMLWLTNYMVSSLDHVHTPFKFSNLSPSMVSAGRDFSSYISLASRILGVSDGSLQFHVHMRCDSKFSKRVNMMLSGGLGSLQPVSISIPFL